MAAVEHEDVIVVPSITSLGDDVAGRVVLTGSHGGLFTGRLAAARRLGGVVFHDAGGGLADAGTEGVRFLGARGVPAVAVGHDSARVGDPIDMRERGVITAVNAAAAACGIRPGDDVATALSQLIAHRGAEAPEAALPSESRFTVPGTAGRPLVLADSASLVGPGDAGAVVVTGSHGGLVGGDPSLAVRAECFAAVFNDAGIGVDDAGVARLPALDERGILGVTVSHRSARIGDGVSSLAGTVSRCNRLASRAGVSPGDRLAPHVMRWAGWAPAGS